MWKKDEAEETPEAPPRQKEPKRSESPPRQATIGRSITIKGEVTGNEDLLIEGTVDGSVDLREHAVTVGKEGEVKASIRARVVTVEGSVVGDLNAEERVVLRSSARVEGDITSPRVVLDDGARFRGGVDMGGDPIRDDNPGDGAAQGTEAAARKASVTQTRNVGTQTKDKNGGGKGETGGSVRTGASATASADPRS